MFASKAKTTVIAEGLRIIGSVSADGAVQVNGQIRFATAAGSYLSSNDKRLHFGLGPADSADIEIKWPSGILQVLRHVKANQFITIEESLQP